MESLAEIGGVVGCLVLGLGICLFISPLRIWHHTAATSVKMDKLIRETHDLLVEVHDVGMLVKAEVTRRNNDKM